MPSSHLVFRYTCSARNAFNPSAALVAAFIPRPTRHFSRASSPQNWGLEAHDHVEKQQHVQESPPVRKVANFYEEAFRKHGTGSDVKPSEIEQSQGEAPPSKNIARRVQAWDPKVYSAIDVDSRRQRAQNRHLRAKDIEPKDRNLARKLNAENGNGSVKGLIREEPNGSVGRALDWSSSFAIDPRNVQHRGDNWKKHQHILGKRAHEISQENVSADDKTNIAERRRWLNYNAMYIDPPQSPATTPLPIPWLASVDESAGKNVMERLDLEIHDFASWMDCTPMESAARSHLLTDLSELVRNAVGSKVHIQPFGSQETGLATVLSDIDIRLCFYSNPGARSDKLWSRMKSLEQALLQHQEFLLVSLRNAKWPIINAQHRHTGIDVQIVSAPETNAQREAMIYYLDKVPHLRPVYMVLRTAFGIRGLVDVYNGGIGSYGLFMMLVASLQRPSSKPPDSAAKSLLRFLEFYSDLDMSKYGVSVSPPKLFKKHDVFTTDTKSHIEAARRRGDHVRAAQWAIGQARIYQPYLFCLQDPANPLNDLGKKSNAIKHIQTTTRVFRNTLRKYINDCWPHIPDPAPWMEGSMLLPLMGRCHEIYRDRRTKAEAEGQIAMEKQQMRNAGQALGAKARKQEIAAAQEGN